MNILNRVKLGNKNYYIICNCEYRKINGMIRLNLKEYKDNYYDGGDLSKLIKRVEKNYNEYTYKKYGNENWFLSDCLYIYDNIPFIEGIGDFYILPRNGVFNSASYISKDELNKIIMENNIEMNRNSEFKLYDERSWNNSSSNSFTSSD